MPYTFRTETISGLLIGILLAACINHTDARSQNLQREDPQEAIVRALKISEEGWNHGNLDQHVSIYDSSATFMTKQGPRQGIPIIREMLEKAFWKEGNPIQQLRFEEVVVRSLGDHHALVTGKFVLSGGSVPESSGRFSTIWQHTPAGWKTIHDHSS